MSSGDKDERTTMDALSMAMIASVWGHYVGPLIMLVIGLSLVIFTHELGHFLLAKWVGIKVERFAIGFGPRLVGIRRGETDYCINVLPLGGYVKMLGQEDLKPMEEEEGPGDPRAFNNKSVGARLLVISAGVVMNVITAAVLFVIVGLAGIRFFAPVVGGVKADSPAAKAVITWDGGEGATKSTGLAPGDRITAIDGREIHSFAKLKTRAVMARADSRFCLKVERRGEGGVRTGTTTLGVHQIDDPRMGKIFVFGIEPASDVVFERARRIAGDTPFREGDRLVAINDARIEHAWDVGPVEKTLDGRPVRIAVERDGREVTLEHQPAVRFLRLSDAGLESVFFLADGTRVVGTVTAGDPDDEDTAIEITTADGEKRKFKGGELLPGSGRILDILGMTPPLTAAGVVNGSYAQKAGVQPGDVIVRYGDRNYPTLPEFHRISREVQDEGTTIVVQRGGKTLEPLKVRPKKRKGSFQIGMVPGVDLTRAVVGDVRRGSPAAAAGITPDDSIVAVNGQAVETWPDVLARLRQAEGQSVRLSVRRAGSDQPLAVAIGPLTREIFDPSLYHVNLFQDAPPFQALLGPEVRMGPVAAVGWGIRETWDFLLDSYGTIRALATRTVSPKNVQGIVGIGDTAIQIGRRGFIYFVYFMAIISVALAVVNFLPIPVVDGGHAVFLLLEKIRGKPLSMKVMNAIQMGGVAVLILVFVLVTWNDIARIVSRSW